MSKSPLTVAQAAERLGVTTEAVRQRCASGKLPAFNAGTGQRKHWRIDPDDLERELERLSNPPRQAKRRGERMDEAELDELLK